MESVGFVLIFLTWRVFNAQCALIFIVHTQFSPSNSPCHPHHCYNQYVMLNQGMKKFAFVGGLVGDWNGIYKQYKQQLLLTATGGLLGWVNASGNFPSCMFNLSLICKHGNYIHELILTTYSFEHKLHFTLAQTNRDLTFSIYLTWLFSAFSQYNMIYNIHIWMVTIWLFWVIVSTLTLNLTLTYSILYMVSSVKLSSLDLTQYRS